MENLLTTTERAMSIAKVTSCLVESFGKKGLENIKKLLFY
ncbi:hypothetical protein HMPREF9176_1180 [Streptococcus downei F0415]|nr:hypothetical protein HMPREF9176_1180 [Streptococcus downei F0415]